MRQTARLLRTAKLLAVDPSVPRWLRGLFVFGLLPIPLFLDELALIVATGMLFAWHRRVVVEAWRRAAREVVPLAPGATAAGEDCRALR
jgi:hypothetical protein